MKSVNIIKRLEKEGYEIIYKKWQNWNTIPYIRLDGFDFTIAKKVHDENLGSCKLDFVYHEVQEALDIARKNNPLFIKKIEQSPSENWRYGRYLILNMGDYYAYKKGKYPFHFYFPVLDKLKKEFK